MWCRWRVYMYYIDALELGLVLTRARSGGCELPEGKNMTKAELVEAVAQQTRLTKKSASEIIDVVFDNIGEAVKKDIRFSYPGFGTWSIRTRKARKIRNPQTNEIMKLKATKTIGFRPAKELKDTL